MPFVIRAMSSGGTKGNVIWMSRCVILILDGTITEFLHKENYKPVLKNGIMSKILMISLRRGFIFMDKAGGLW
jgi:hypothetical protein